MAPYNKSKVRAKGHKNGKVCRTSVTGVCDLKIVSPFPLRCDCSLSCSSTPQGSRIIGANIDLDSSRESLFSNSCMTNTNLILYNQTDSETAHDLLVMGRLLDKSAYVVRLSAASNCLLD